MELVIIDSAGIQRYVFASNRLKENIGASHLVASATGAWALEALPEPNNVVDAGRGTLDVEREIDRHGLAAEVVYQGGGNLVALLAGRIRVAWRASRADVVARISDQEQEA